MVFGNLSPRSLSGCARGRYQSSFCGSCHAMAELGRPWALTSGYDIAFLHLVMAVLEKAPVERLSCTAVPFRKLPVRRLSPDSRRWLTAVNMLLIEEKCRDDVADEGGLKAKLGLKLVRRQAERARETVSGSGFSGDLISTLSERQGELERETLPLERYAQPTRLLWEISLPTPPHSPAVLTFRPPCGSLVRDSALPFTLRTPSTIWRKIGDVVALTLCSRGSTKQSTLIGLWCER